MSDLLNQASLVMVPSGYKEDTVYSVVPSDGSGDLSFTRASNGTRINSAGLVEVCPWNLLEYSQEIGNGIAWQSLNSIVITPNSTTAPDGTMTADTLLDVGGASIVRQFDYSVVAGQTYTFSVYLKKATGSPLTRIRIEQDQSPYNNTYIDVTPTNEWVRYSVTRTIEAGITSVNYGIFPDINNGDSVYAWGAQVNIGSTAKPYFPTTDRLNVPRLTYQNGGGGCPSLLLEKQSTNLALYSEQFDNAAWSKSNVTITANNTTSPDGTQNADLATATSGGELLQGLVLNTSTSYTFSFYVKKGTATDAKYRVYNFDAGANVVSPTSYISQTNTSTWVRVSVSFTSSATGVNYGIYLLDSALAGTMYLWGAQAEPSSYPTSYIPTTSSSATRVADACFKTGISSLFGTNQGTLFVDIANAVEIDLPQVTADDNSNTNRFLLYRELSNGYWSIFISAGGTTSNYSSTVSSTGGKFAIAYNSSGFLVYKDGAQILSFSNTVPSSLSAIRLNGRATNDLYTNKQIKEAILFPTKLTATELAQLTA